MRHVMSKVIALIVLAAALALPAGHAQANWTTSDNHGVMAEQWTTADTDEGIGDPVVCHDGISFGWGLASAPQRPRRIKRNVSVYRKADGGPFKQIGNTEKVKLFRLKNWIEIPDIAPGNYAGFPMLLWPEDLPKDTSLIMGITLEGAPKTYKVTVQDCMLILDDFDSDGPPNTSWDGDINGYKVVGGGLRVSGGGPLYWKEKLGIEQEAWVEFDRIDTHGSEQGLLLGVQDDGQGKPDWSKGAIRVVYDAKAKQIHVAVSGMGSSQGWEPVTCHPQKDGCIPLPPKVTLNTGDQLRVRVSKHELQDGRKVSRVYVLRSPKPGVAGREKLIRNAKVLGAFEFDTFPSWSTGRIGLWFSKDAGDTVVKQFGGGEYGDEPDPVSDTRWSDGGQLTQSPTWWEVDLRAIKLIDNIQIYRTNCCQQPPNNFYILVSDTPFESTDLGKVLNQKGVFHEFIGKKTQWHPLEPINQMFLEEKLFRTGRYVRIQWRATNPLSLAGFDVWGPVFP